MIYIVTVHLHYYNLFIFIICFEISRILFAPLECNWLYNAIFGICLGIKANNMSDLILFNLIQSVFKIDTCQFVTLMTMKMPWNTECFGLFSKTNIFVCDAVNAEKLQTLWLCDKFVIAKKHNPILSSRLVKVSSKIKMTDSQKLFYINDIQIILTFYHFNRTINIAIYIYIIWTIWYGSYHMDHIILCISYDLHLLKTYHII